MFQTSLSPRTFTAYSVFLSTVVPSWKRYCPLFFFFLTIRPQKPLSSLTFRFPTSETLISSMQYSDRHSNISVHSHSISIPIDNSSPVQITSLKSLSCEFPLVLLLHRTFQVKPQPYINLTLPFLYSPKQLDMEKNNIRA